MARAVAHLDGAPVQGYEARAENGAAINGTPHPEPSSSASAHRPAAVHANAATWDVLYARGHQFQLEGNLVAAAAAYRQAIQLNPQHAAALYDLGYVLQLQGETEAAIEYYQGAIAHQPRHAFAHYNLGTLLQAKGDAKGAIAHYEAAAAIQPENPYIYYDWARSLEAIGDAAAQPPDTEKRSHSIPTIAPASMPNNAWPCSPR